jgi:serine/threonine protein kinase
MHLEFDNKVLFNKLNIYFYDNIRLSLKTPNKIFIITKKDIFYEINIYDENLPSFVISNDDSIIKSMVIKELSGKNIIDLSYGFCHYIAWNNKREVFCWGNNCCGQFGNGKRGEVENTKKLENALKHTSEDFIFSCIYGNHQNEVESNVLLSDMNIDVIKCGYWHSLALTKSGEVLVWGLKSRDGNIEEMCQLDPIKLDGFDGERVTMISCGYKHSMALTVSGRVFSWGENSFGQLGHVNEIYRVKPKLINLKNIIIQKISCGKYHSMLLSNDGVIYAFGDNKWGQIGNGSKKMQMTPVKLTHLNKFWDIASNFIEDISVSLSIENHFYIWGKCGEDIHLTPYQTSCKSFIEVFSMFTQIQYVSSEQLINFNDSFFRYGYFESEYGDTEIIGEGGFGKVFKVIDTNENEFAIKCVKPLAKYEKEFLREFKNHVHFNTFESEYIVKHFDSWFENKINSDGLSLYIKMELCDKTLEGVMNEIHREFLRTDDDDLKILNQIGYFLASYIFIEILRGVLCLHKNKIIHRDLNLWNILFKIERNGFVSVKIADFGLSVLHEYTDQSHTRDKGSPKYTAPEVTISETYDTKADIYSLGIVFQGLFNIDPTKYETISLKLKLLHRISGNNQVDSDQDCNLLERYRQALELYSHMTDNVPGKRPDCVEILESKHLWALDGDDFDSKNENDFNSENEIKMVLDSILEEKIFVHSILESLLITIQMKKINEGKLSNWETSILHEKTSDFIRKFLDQIKIHKIINSKLRTNLIDSILVLMRKFLDSIEIQQKALKAFASLFYSIEKDSKETLNPEQLEKVIEVTLTAMERYPNNQKLQKSALRILYSKQALKNPSSVKYKCIKLVMDSLVNFKKADMNLMASVICTTHLVDFSIKERSDLGSNNIYIATLLEMIKSRVNFYSNLYLIENSLSALVNFIVDSVSNCTIFMKLGGLNVSFSLLEVRINNFNSNDFR